MLPGSFLFGFLWPKDVLRPFTAEARTSPGHNMAEARASQVINTAEARATTSLGYSVR